MSASGATPLRASAGTRLRCGATAQRIMKVSTKRCGTTLRGGRRSLSLFLVRGVNGMTDNNKGKRRWSDVCAHCKGYPGYERCECVVAASVEATEVKAYELWEWREGADFGYRWMVWDVDAMNAMWFPNETGARVSFDALTREDSSESDLPVSGSSGVGGERDA